MQCKNSSELTVLSIYLHLELLENIIIGHTGSLGFWAPDIA